ncbi:MAG: fumarylacetoacetate hydrolase family protein [Bacteroidota bacterium]|jgi:5-carboxymethyl-2-hydroxymuconate isomerase
MKTLKVRGSDKDFTVGNVFCVGRNYAEHVKEMKSEIPTTPVIFLKPSSAVIRDGEDIVRPSISKQLHHEVELVVAIGSHGKNVSAQDAAKHIFGFAVGLDMTLRDIQAEAKTKGLPWAIAKGFDTSAPVSEIIPASMMHDPQALEIKCFVNGALRQQTTIDKMIFSIDSVIAFISTLFTLEAGDLVFTGTPEGVGTVSGGDLVRAELVGWTSISHHVKTLS